MTAVEIFGLLIVLTFAGVTVKHIIPFLFKATLFIGKYVVYGVMTLGTMMLLASLFV